MTDDEARRLALRIIDTWPTGPKAYVWRDLLTPLEHELAKETYRRLDREITKGAPTPGHFRALYTVIRREHEPRLPNMPQPDEPWISRAEYLTRLIDRAQHNPSAREELATWERFG